MTRLTLIRSVALTIVAWLTAGARAGFELRDAAIGTSITESCSGTFCVVGTTGLPPAIPMSGGTYTLVPTGGPAAPGNGLGDDSCPADVTGDGFIDIDDIVTVVIRFDEPGGEGDVNGDGIVDVDDLVEVVLAWGLCPEA